MKCFACDREATRYGNDDIFTCICEGSRGYVISWSGIWHKLGYQYKG